MSPPVPEQALTGYVRALRAAGAATSTAETLDAVRAVSVLGWSDRDALKAALGAALAKSIDEKRLHDALFELYFAPASPVPTSAPASAPAIEPAMPTSADAVDSLLALAASSANPAGPSDLLQAAIARAAQAEQVDQIRFSSQIPYLTNRVLQAMGIAALQARLAQLLADDPSGMNPALEPLQQARGRLQQAARAWVSQRFELFGRPATDTFMTDVVLERPIGRLAPSDMARMKVAVARMARRLAQRHLRRQRHRERGSLDMRRTLRANAGHDHLPFTLVWRHRQRDRPRIVAVCDVSGSVAAHVRFLLLFLHALHEVVEDLRTFAFSSDLHDAGPLLASDTFDEAMAGIIRLAGSGATDYGRAWETLHREFDRCIDRRTTLIVLGDGRGNHADPRLDLFAGFAQRAKRVVWLCPEPPGRWGSGDSDIPRYRPWCTDLQFCATPLDLERIIDEALLAYR